MIAILLAFASSLLADMGVNRATITKNLTEAGFELTFDAGAPASATSDERPPALFGLNPNTGQSVIYVFSKEDKEIAFGETVAVPLSGEDVLAFLDQCYPDVGWKLIEIRSGIAFFNSKKDTMFAQAGVNTPIVVIESEDGKSAARHIAHVLAQQANAQPMPQGVVPFSTPKSDKFITL